MPTPTPTPLPTDFQLPAEANSWSCENATPVPVPGSATEYYSPSASCVVTGWQEQSLHDMRRLTDFQIAGTSLIALLVAVILMLVVGIRR